jgi:hypothetical protein
MHVAKETALPPVKGKKAIGAVTPMLTPTLPAAAAFRNSRAACPLAYWIWGPIPDAPPPISRPRPSIRVAIPWIAPARDTLLGFACEMRSHHRAPAANSPFGTSGLADDGRQIDTDPEFICADIRQVVSGIAVDVMVNKAIDAAINRPGRRCQMVAIDRICRIAGYR